MYNTEYFWDIARPYIMAKLGVDGTDDHVFETAKKEGLKIHFLKRLSNKRMERAVNMVQAIWPDSVLDVGAGKGFLIWHLSEKLPNARFAAVDIFAKRVYRIDEACKAAGLECEIAVCDGSELPYEDNSFAAVTLFEVLEHVESPEKVLAEAIRTAKKDVLVSVPCVEDDNPEHIRAYLKEKELKQLVETASVGHDVRNIISKDTAHWYLFISKRSWTTSSEQSSGPKSILYPRP